MVGYVGERARRSRRRFFYIIFFVIFFLTIIYFSYKVNVKDEKGEIYNEITSTDDNIDTEQLSINKEDVKLKIIEKEQKIVFRDKQIKSLKKQINDLKEEKNNLSEKNQELLVSLDTLNSEIEKNSQAKNDAVKEKVKEFNLEILQLKKENEKILNEYENVVKKNLELDLELKSLNIEKMEIKLLNIEKMGKISDLEQVINEQKEIIESLKDNNPH